MKQLITCLAAVLFCTATNAQTAKPDTAVDNDRDTIRIGSIVIIKKGKSKNGDVDITMGRKSRQRKQNSNISTNWWIVDLGFSNYDDKTNYATAGSYLINRPGSPALGSSDFKVQTGKSINVNIWFFMQRLNLVQHYLNLKYGFGLELNNYRYKTSSRISYKESGPVPYTGTPTNAPFIFRDSIAFSKNKLALDYLTVPVMLNINTNPGSRRRGISISAGVSAGYLYSQRNKQKSSERGKDRNKGDYDLERFKLSYVGELGLGPVHFYGSYSPKSMYQHSLDMRPYTIGLRLSNW